MGRIYDALRRAEQDRRLPAGESRPEPAVLVDVAAVENGRKDPVLAPESNGTPVERLPGAATATLPPATLVAVTDPGSPPAEHLRAVKSRLVRLFDDEGYRSLLITSPGRGDGKSLTAANLALLLAAEVGRRALLVDADLRKPALHRLFGLPQGPGLGEVAAGRVRWRDALLETPWNGLALLPAGGGAGSPAELLNSPASKAFFADVRSAFDFVVVDAPPVLPVADAAVVASLVDAVLLVVRHEQTPRTAVPAAVEALQKFRLVGMVLNGLPESHLGGRHYYSY